MWQQTRTEQCKNLVITLRELQTHTQSFPKMIVKYLESSGLTDIWVESEVFSVCCTEIILNLMNDMTPNDVLPLKNNCYSLIVYPSVQP